MHKSHTHGARSRDPLHPRRGLSQFSCLDASETPEVRHSLIVSGSAGLITRFIGLIIQVRRERFVSARVMPGRCELKAVRAFEGPLHLICISALPQRSFFHDFSHFFTLLPWTLTKAVRGEIRVMIRIARMQTRSHLAAG